MKALFSKIFGTAYRTSLVGIGVGGGLIGTQAFDLYMNGAPIHGDKFFIGLALAVIGRLAAENK